MPTVSQNERIAKNTIMLYIRTVVVLFVSLYTSRMVLKALGAEDLGIYNVVGGIVALLSFFRIALSKSTSRFITYELGNGNDGERLRRIYSSAMTIHIIITLIVIVLGESLGILVLNYWTDIPELRQPAAQWVYQCSLLTFAVQILTAPYESIVIAYEKMNIYAYLSILSAILKLVVVLVILDANIDHLILYSILLVTVDFIIFIGYYLYDKKNYIFLRFKLTWDKEYSYKIFAFSGWTVLGSSANAATQQGVSLLFNNFVGLIANTALGFANQVNGAVGSFVGSFQTAFNPQVIKLYAQGEQKEMHLLMTRASKFSFVLAYVLALPLIVNMDYVLSIWLGDVPLYTVEFCQLILICCVIDSTTGVFNTAITATGDIKGYQIGISLSFCLDLLTAAVLLFLNLNPTLVFGSRILTRGLINMAIGLYFSKKQLDFSITNYTKDVVAPIILMLAITIPLMIVFVKSDSGFKCLLLSCIVSLISCTVITFFAFANKGERKVISQKLKATFVRR